MNIRQTYQIQTRPIFSFSFSPPIKLHCSLAETRNLNVTVEIEKNWDTLLVSGGLGDLKGLADGQ